jgi:hypothetical protein
MRGQSCGVKPVESAISRRPSLVPPHGPRPAPPSVAHATHARSQASIRFRRRDVRRTAIDSGLTPRSRPARCHRGTRDHQFRAHGPTPCVIYPDYGPMGAWSDDVVSRFVENHATHLSWVVADRSSPRARLDNGPWEIGQLTRSRSPPRVPVPRCRTTLDPASSLDTVTDHDDRPFTEPVVPQAFWTVPYRSPEARVSYAPDIDTSRTICDLGKNPGLQVFLLKAP